MLERLGQTHDKEISSFFILSPVRLLFSSRSSLFHPQRLFCLCVGWKLAKLAEPALTVAILVYYLVGVRSDSVDIYALGQRISSNYVVAKLSCREGYLVQELCECLCTEGGGHILNRRRGGM